MPLTYRRPGVYLEESLLVNSSDTANTVTVSCFVGVAEKGPINEPTLCQSWSDYVTAFGAFNPVPNPDSAKPPTVLSYLPFEVFSFFQNGGRTAWVIRAAPSDPQDRGSSASIVVNGVGAGASLTAFNIVAQSTGAWGNTLKYALTTQTTIGTGATAADVFAIQIIIKNPEGNDEIVETFSSLSILGDLPGTRKIDAVVNDPVAGSRYVTITGATGEVLQPATTPQPVPLAGGIDPNIPDAADLVASAQGVTKVDGPILLNIVGYLLDATKADTVDAPSVWQGATTPSSAFIDRQDIFVINDNAPPRAVGTSSASYKTTIQSSTALGANSGDSYSASYGPWLIIPHPARVGTTVTIPPAGAVMGMTARVDATIGVFRAPAGTIAGLSNAVGVQSKFTDTELGDLNAQNINMIRSVVGAGICVMGGRTRKTYGTDRYVSARRTLIYLKEILRRSTQFAVFQNNDQRLWSALRMAADRILRPLWEAGGLAGANSSQAYYIRCDDTINTPSVIQGGEVRMEIGVALEYPAEFVVIRLTQFDQNTFTTEIQPAA